MECELAYDNSIVTSNPLYQTCGSFLCEVAQKDYGAKYFRPEIVCLDMDYCESLAAVNEKRRKEATVDAVIGVKPYNKNRFSHARLLLVELRMKYLSPKNLSKNRLESKVRHTLALLSTDESVCQTKLFIFRDDVIQQMEGWFKEHAREGGIIRNCEAWSVSKFNELIKSEREFPYKPITDIKEMKESIGRYLRSWDSLNFFKSIEYWLNIANSFRYNPDEFYVIMKGLKDVWDDFRTSGVILSEDEELNAEIIEEDYLNT
ncbi:hypothetical protein HDR70_06310 [bacterium]|nr:hypothetical protein [bacterium]MDE6254581.1 hypothetical protein [Muribaculaceae bacterium]